MATDAFTILFVRHVTPVGDDLHDFANADIIVFRWLREELTIVMGELRVQIEAVQRNLALAQEADQPYEAHLHQARLDDLIELATRHRIDPSSCVHGPLPAPERVNPRSAAPRRPGDDGSGEASLLAELSSQVRVPARGDGARPAVGCRAGITVHTAGCWDTSTHPLPTR